MAVLNPSANPNPNTAVPQDQTRRLLVINFCHKLMIQHFKSTELRISELTDAKFAAANTYIAFMESNLHNRRFTPSPVETLRQLEAAYKASIAAYDHAKALMAPYEADVAAAEALIPGRRILTPDDVRAYLRGHDYDDVDDDDDFL